MEYAQIDKTAARHSRRSALSTTANLASTCYEDETTNTSKDIYVCTSQIQTSTQLVQLTAE